MSAPLLPSALEDVEDVLNVDCEDLEDVLNHRDAYSRGPQMPESTSEVLDRLAIVANALAFGQISGQVGMAATQIIYEALVKAYIGRPFDDLVRTAKQRIADGREEVGPATGPTSASNSMTSAGTVTNQEDTNDPT